MNSGLKRRLVAELDALPLGTGRAEAPAKLDQREGKS